jgi:hypothetical protein
MDVCAAIEQQCDDVWRAPDHRAVQRRAARAVAAMHEGRVGVEQRAHLLQIAGLCRQMNRMIGVRL